MPNRFDDTVTLAEVYRLLKSMDVRYTGTLADIKSDVKEVKIEAKITNGRVGKLEARVAVHDYIVAAFGAVGLAWLGIWLAKIL